MGTGGRVAAAVAAGYLLGRTKKLKLAITVGSMMAGKRLATNPRGLLRQASEYVDNNEQLAPLADQVRGSLLEAGRSAAVSVASNRLEAFSDSLHERSDQWRELPSSGDEDEEEPADESESEVEDEAEVEDERDTDEEPEVEEESPPAAPKKSSKASTAKKTTKKTTAKKAPAKKTTTKKATTKKAAPTKKQSSTKKSSSAKKTTSGRSPSKTRS